MLIDGSSKSRSIILILKFFVKAGGAEMFTAHPQALAPPTMQSTPGLLPTVISEMKSPVGWTPSAIIGIVRGPQPPTQCQED